MYPIAKAIGYGGRTQLVRIYGLGFDHICTDSDKKLISIMLEECIGYIESPTSKESLDTYRIREEYASQILKKHGITDNSELITGISSSKYEGAECRGSIKFCSDSGETETKPLIEFKKVEFVPENSRIIRKYLEMCKDGYYLCAKRDKSGFYIFGMDDSICIKGSLLQFTGYRSWRILDESGSPLLKRSGERYIVSDCEQANLSIERSLRDLCKLVTQNDSVENLLGIVRAAKLQQHGTMIVFTSESNAKILSSYFCEINRGTKLKEAVSLKSSGKNDTESTRLIMGLSSIDGALIVDTNGYCHAFGVILDGTSNVECNISRGARYNSALTFINHKDFEKTYGFNSNLCRVIVFSEDKTVDILSNDTNVNSENTPC